MDSKKKQVYAFIDSQNLNLGIRGLGWKLDFARFRVYLKDKYKVSKAYLFVGYIEKNQKMYNALESHGYILVFKPTIVKKNETKGNVDAELVLHTMIQYPNYYKAIIVTGDGDFHCLVEYLDDTKKLEKLIIPNQKKYSQLLSKFKAYIDFMNDKKTKLGL